MTWDIAILAGLTATAVACLVAAFVLQRRDFKRDIRSLLKKFDSLDGEEHR